MGQVVGGCCAAGNVKMKGQMDVVIVPLPPRIQGLTYSVNLIGSLQPRSRVSPLRSLGCEEERPWE